MRRTSVESDIHEAIGRLTAAEKRAARALIGNYPALGLGPVAEFAAAAGTSSASVLRFLGQLGFSSYPEFQRRLREELEERIKSPLDKAASAPPRVLRGDLLGDFAERAIANLRDSLARLPAAEFDGACSLIADERASCHLAGGRFTGSIAEYMAAHLRVIRPNVRLFDARTSSRSDQLLDTRANDVAILMDIRRYDPQMLELAKLLKGRRVRIVLVTDEWISPVSRYSKFVLPCRVDVGGAWDSNLAVVAICDAIIARVTDLNWERAEQRIAQKERLAG